MAMQNEMLKDRTVGIGVYTKQEALDWGITGPGLRATGSDWDVRKKRPYGGYDQFEFDVPTATNGDCYDRAALRIEEMRREPERLFASASIICPVAPTKVIIRRPHRHRKKRPWKISKP